MASRVIGYLPGANEWQNEPNDFMTPDLASHDRSGPMGARESVLMFAKTQLGTELVTKRL
jgi:hypothetical protein